MSDQTHFYPMDTLQFMTTTETIPKKKHERQHCIARKGYWRIFQFIWSEFIR
jgi:hypothetical protein